MHNRPRTKKSATVTKVIKERVIEKDGVSEIEKAQIELHDGDHLYREIRIPNELEDGFGKKTKLKPGEDVEVTIEADPQHKTDKQS